MGKKRGSKPTRVAVMFRLTPAERMWFQREKQVRGFSAAGLFRRMRQAYQLVSRAEQWGVQESFRSCLTVAEVAPAEVTKTDPDSNGVGDEAVGTA